MIRPELPIASYVNLVDEPSLPARVLLVAEALVVQVDTVIIPVWLYKKPTSLYSRVP
jgi:hypothetical protein